QDVLYLLAAYPVAEGDAPGTTGLDRIRAIVADDWGWWRTLTGTVDHAYELAGGEHPELVPAGARHDVLSGLRRIREAADTVQKTLRWKVRARIGERKRWYQQPEEEGHEGRRLGASSSARGSSGSLPRRRPSPTVGAAATC